MHTVADNSVQEVTGATDLEKEEDSMLCEDMLDNKACPEKKSPGLRCCLRRNPSGCTHLDRLYPLHPQPDQVAL